MSIPSDANYIPAATSEVVLNSEIYKQLLSMNIDPYAAPRDEGLIQMLEEQTFVTGDPE
jgi:hypothetical protein